MILEIYLSTRADRNYSTDHYYASPDAVQKGVRVDAIAYLRDYYEEDDSRYHTYD